MRADRLLSILLLPLLLDALRGGRQVRFICRRVPGEAGGRTSDPLGLDTPCHRPAAFDLAAYWENAASEFREKLPRYYATYEVEPGVMRRVRREAA